MYGTKYMLTPSKSYVILTIDHFNIVISKIKLYYISLQYFFNLSILELYIHFL